MGKNTTARLGAEITHIHQCYRVAGYNELSNSARVIYRCRCRELIRKKQLFWVDLAQLIRYAWTYSEWEKEISLLKTESLVLSYIDKFGNTRYYANPRVKIVRDFSNDLNVIESHFGFTPWDRKHLGISNTDNKDILSEWINNNCFDSQKPSKHSTVS